jgi:outer membrane protein TolC
LTYTHSETRRKYPPSTLRPYYSFSTTFDNNFSLSLPLYSGGRLEGLTEKAKINAQIADQEVSKTRQQIRLAAITGYYNVLQARNMLQVSQESVDRLAAHLKNVELQYDVGKVAKSDVLRSQVELANAQQNLIKARNAYDLSLANLNNVIGLPLDSQVKVKEALTHEPYTLSLEQSVEYALVNRPEILQAKAAIDSARQGVRVAKSGFLPSLTLSGSIGWNDRDFPARRIIIGRCFGRFIEYF